jgi:hypothetical protein
MSRLTPTALATQAWRTSTKPKPPRGMSPAARAVWRRIVDDRPGDWFRASNIHLLEQLCEAVAAQREVLAKLQATPTDKELVKTVSALGNLTIALSTKLRLTVQADVVRQSRKIDQREPKANVLLGGWERPA